MEKMELRAKYALCVKWNRENGCHWEHIDRLLATAQADEAPEDALWKHPQVGWIRLGALRPDHPFRETVKGMI